MQKVGDVRWLDDRIAELRANIDFHRNEIKKIEEEILALVNGRAKIIEDLDKPN
jgi:chorismate mutase